MSSWHIFHYVLFVVTQEYLMRINSVNNLCYLWFRLMWLSHQVIWHWNVIITRKFCVRFKVDLQHIVVSMWWDILNLLIDSSKYFHKLGYRYVVCGNTDFRRFIDWDIVFNVYDALVLQHLTRVGGCWSLFFFHILLSLVLMVHSILLSVHHFRITHVVLSYSFRTFTFIYTGDHVLLRYIYNHLILLHT